VVENDFGAAVVVCSNKRGIADVDNISGGSTVVASSSAFSG
jgi:hypothetical protein